MDASEFTIGIPAVDLPLLVLAAAAVVVVIVIFAVIIAVLRSRGRKPEPASLDLRINLADLPCGGPPEEGPRLEIYGTPVRLAALVLAPAGRNNQLPPADKLSETIEDLLPRLMAIITSHRPRLLRWPFQLSTQGFAHSFFNNVPLPGDRGKGTPWCCVAGRFESGDQQLLAGLVCTGAKPNSLSQITVAHVGQWMDVIRVRG